jgi:hypothetical protein
VVFEVNLDLIDELIPKPSLTTLIDNPMQSYIFSIFMIQKESAVNRYRQSKEGIYTNDLPIP